jgi:alkylation response protein AidB-like acyl-CoA dehydrogenase
MSALSSEEIRLLRDSVARFVDENYPFEKRRERLLANPFGTQWENFAELGWLALAVAEEAGGLGARVTDLSGLLMELGRGLVEEPYIDGIVLAGGVIAELGSAAQRDELLPLMIGGERCLCLCHRESGGELDRDSIRVDFRQEADRYIIDGRKSVICAAEWADTLLVTARRGTDLALFLVSANHPGLQLHPFKCVDGGHAADIVFNHVEVGSGARLGDRNLRDAWPGLKKTLLRGTAALCAEAAGIARALREGTASYLRTRQQFGQPLASFQALQHRFADMVGMELEISAAASLAATAADSAEDIEMSEESIRLAKARIGQIGRRIAEEAIQLHGGIGFTEEFIVGHYLRRMLVIDNRLGDSQEHVAWLGRRAAE